MKKVKDWLLKDLWLKVVSILLAIVIWFVWIQIENPTIPKDFSGVKVSIINQSELNPDKKVWEILNNSDTVRVTVTAPKTVINGLTADDIIAEADASKMTDNEIPITLRLAGDVTYDSLKPNHDTVSLSIEDRARKYVRITRNVTGEVAENYKYNGVTMDLNMIEITGRKSEIEQVSYGQVDIDIDGISESLSANIEIELYDKSNHLLNLSSVTKQSGYVHVDVSVLETKRIPIYASKTGDPAEGYLYAKNISISPEVIVLAGTAADLQSISRVNITEPVDISKAEGNVTQSIDITPYIPENLIYEDDDFDGLVDVTVYVEEEQTREFSFLSSDVSLVNAPEDCDLSIEFQNITATLSGLASDLEGISVDSIGKTVDVAEWMDDAGYVELEEGTYHMPITLGVSSSVKLASKPVVTVVVKK